MVKHLFVIFYLWVVKFYQGDLAALHDSGHGIE